MHPYIKGQLVDAHTRCTHYHSLLDIIAIKFKCCNSYYACIHCHEEHANHPLQIWKKDEWNYKAVFCGNCTYELTINEYFNCKYHCPSCSSAFNPKCSNHNHLYFDMIS
ncbi:CHY zinc finger protein [Ferruginibacter sp.]|uniref:CHY zinc finger protein n=1 Tax=Ferruginibacter sp. TaxID=1940288 RepID=UPI0019A93134|nr:CHY zinc finger protein [Ferruginibacter sp.]MBC7628355.1 hypothetical protein [Ferruginibacter sp.]